MESAHFSTERLVDSLRQAATEEGWKIAERDFLRLLETAPDVPDGKHVFRSIRVRFGEGSSGVVETFKAHCRRLRHTFGAEGFRCDDRFGAPEGDFDGRDVNRIGLFAGDETHRAGAEWVLIDLAAGWNRKSIRSIRDDSRLADELLAFAWMRPDIVRRIDYRAHPGWLAAGYVVVPPHVEADTRGMEAIDIRYGWGSSRVWIATAGSGHCVPYWSAPCRMASLH